MKKKLFAWGLAIKPYPGCTYRNLYIIISCGWTFELTLCCMCLSHMQHANPIKVANTHIAILLLLSRTASWQKLKGVWNS